MQKHTCLRWADINSRGGFNAALWVSPVARAWQVAPHSHDYYEMTFVIGGTAKHRINGQEQTLAPGDMLLIRPTDYHSIEVRSRAALQFINVSFEADLWSRFGKLCGEEKCWRAWDTAGEPPTLSLTGVQRTIAENAFRAALDDFYDERESLALFGFWSTTTTLLQRRRKSLNLEPGLDATAPGWLIYACTRMHKDEELQAGLPRLLEFSGVSMAHLCRSMQAHCGHSPTEWLNRLRLHRAQRYMATTTLDIGEIAAQCGFNSPSHFYSLFRRHFGETPRAFRARCNDAITPPVRSKFQ